MIIAYLASIPTYHEGEDIEIRYTIYQNSELICKENFYSDYEKPVLVGLKAIHLLLEKLTDYNADVFKIIINDAALNELVKGTSSTKKGDVLKLASMVKRKINRFPGEIIVYDVTNNHNKIIEWNEAIKIAIV